MNEALPKIAYTVVQGETREELIQVVTAHIQQGWLVSGGVSLAVDAAYGKPRIYAQAMLRVGR